MNDETKTKSELLAELAQVRERVAALEQSQVNPTPDDRDLQWQNNAIHVHAYELEAANEELHHVQQSLLALNNKLQENEARYRMLANSVSDVIWTMDMNTTFTYVSSSVRRLRGYSVEEAMEQTLDETMTPSSFENAVTAFSNELEQHHCGLRDPESSRTLDVELIRKDGSTVWCEIEANFIFASNQQPVGIIGIARDITERRQAAEELRQKNLEISARVKELQCLYNIASVIETPRISLDEILQRTVELLPPAWQYREITCARIVVKDQEFTTANFIETPWILSSNVIVNNSPAGKIEVYYLEEKPESAEGPFIKEERALINVIAERMGRVTERHYMERDLRYRTRELAERVRELKCLYGVANVIETPGISLDEVLQGTLEYLPLIWQYPDAACARISFENQVFVTEHFAETKWVQTSDIVVSDILVGKIEVYFFKENLELDEAMLLKRDRSLLDVISARLGRVIERYQMQEELHLQSVTDELTGLYNRHYFYSTLDQQTEQMRKYDDVLSLIVIDLDGFKDYNDRFGHINGDRVLRAFGRMILSALRKNDMVFRYGGDEFIVLLPSTNANSAKQILKRIQKNWHKVVEANFSSTQTTLSFSTGIAQFPMDGESADSLMFLADSALYLSKRRGGATSTLVTELDSLSMEVFGMARLDQVYALAATVDAKDPYTYGHSKRVAALAERVGKAIGLSQQDTLFLHSASLLHDIGKVGVPDAVLTKPGIPTNDEWRLIRRHCNEGARIVGHVKELADLVGVILHHHEWYDGSGYPEGLMGDQIPRDARIVSIVDAYDTMTTERRYRDALPHDYATGELQRYAGSQFDPEFVKVFCEIINDAVRQEIYEDPEFRG